MTQQSANDSVAAPVGRGKQFRPTYHRDGSVTIWSVYDQIWRRCRNDIDVGDREYAAMSEEERQKVSARLNGWGPSGR